MAPDAEPDLKLEIAHILTIDVVAYSTLLINAQTRLMQALVQTVRSTPRFRDAEAGGKLIRLPTGDGMALVFLDDAEAPLECAIQIVEGLREHPEITLRMGIHSGAVNTIRDVNDQSNVAGAGIDMAQRVMDCGDAGHILVSKRVADDLAPHPRWNRHLHDLGECVVKHGRRIAIYNFYSDSLGNPATPSKLQCAATAPPPPRSPANRNWAVAAVVLLLLSLFAAAFFFFGRSFPPKHSVAVLPFADASPAKDQEYFSDGITEQIINSIAKVRGLFVVGRTSSFAFKGKNQDVRLVGRSLNVNYVLEGSVSRAGGRFRVDAQLVTTSQGYQVWSKSYDSNEKDILSLQSDVAQKVASALRVEMGITESQQVARAPTYDPEAYDFYLRGRYLLNKRTPESAQSGLQFFQRAVLKDPRFALGHAGIADANILLGKLGVLSAAEAATRARPEVSKAIALDDQLADGYVARGTLLTDFDWNWPAAELDFKKAIELNPSSAAAHHWYARHLAELGRFGEAQHEIEAAQKIDPLSPAIAVSKAKILLVAQQPREAIDACNRALEIEPNFASAYSLLGQAYSLNGEHDKAIAAVTRYVQLSRDSGYANLELAYAYVMAGNTKEADRIVHDVTTAGKAFSPYDMATIYSARSDLQTGFHWLREAVRGHSVDSVWLRVDPRLRNLQANSEFTRLLDRVQASR
ncbi:MAG: tetratricopeptide repeat protein [Chthoniobacterales bacterium]|nr:tetratricopeptide repeat protein [Chthoniobacterales bacterium]